MIIPNYLKRDLQECSVVIHLENVEIIGLNDMYKAGRGGRLLITDQGRKFLNDLRIMIAKSMIGRERFSKWLYRFFMIVGTPEITNTGYLKDAETALKKGQPIKVVYRTKDERKCVGGVEYIDRVKIPVNRCLIKNKDADGPLKAVQDVFFSVLGINDHLITTSSASRVFSETPGLILAICPLCEEDMLLQTQVSREVLSLWISEKRTKRS